MDWLPDLNDVGEGGSIADVHVLMGNEPNRIVTTTKNGVPTKYDERAT